VFCGKHTFGFLFQAVTHIVIKQNVIICSHICHTVVTFWKDNKQVIAAFLRNIT